MGIKAEAPKRVFFDITAFWCDHLCTKNETNCWESILLRIVRAFCASLLCQLHSSDLHISFLDEWLRIATSHSGRRKLDCRMCESWIDVSSVTPVHTNINKLHYCCTSTDSFGRYSFQNSSRCTFVYTIASVME